MTAEGTRRLCTAFLEAVERRDLDAIVAHFAPDASWRNVPHPPAVGQEAIRDLLGPILRRASSVRWDVVAASYEPERAWLERVDRFWIDGQEYAVACNGVFEVGEDCRFAEVRDYVDLGEWRTRLQDVRW